MRTRYLIQLLTLTCVAACSEDRADKQVPHQVARREAPAEPTLAGASAATSAAPSNRDSAPDSLEEPLPDSLRGIPRFGAGMYELVAVRDVPIIDDSAGVIALAHALRDSLAAARDWRDSLRMFKHLVKPLDDVEYALEEADSAEVPDLLRRLTNRRSCMEWQAGGSLRLEADGRFEVERRYRKFCRDSTPAYREWTYSVTSVLEPCREALEPPVPGAVRHLTCRVGRYWDGMYGYRHVGDTLRLGSDCDGSDTYVFRNPQPLPQTVARANGKMRTTDEC